MTTPTETQLADLLAKEEIRELLIRYCHATDRKDAAGIEAVFYPDAMLDFGYFSGGPKDLIAFSDKFLAKFSGTHHSLANIVIKIEGERARALSYITAIHSQWKRRTGVVDMIGYGRYVDALERRDGEWRIAHRTVLFDWSLDLPSSFEWPESMLPNVGRRDHTDPSYRVLGPA